MPGSLFRDANASNLLTGATINAAGTTNSTAVQISKPGPCRLFITTNNAVAGTNPTLQVTVQSADDSGFTTNVKKVGAMPVTSGTNTAQRNQTWVGTFEIWQQYVRLIVTLAGTSPDYTGATAVLRAEHDRETHTVGTVLGDIAAP